MKKLIALLLTVSVGSSYAQDLNFSQFQSSPLTFNPATAGTGEGTGRISATFRHTWIANVTPFITGQLSFDKAILTNKIKETDKFGIGITATNDQSNGGALLSNMIAVSVAYNKGLDEEGNSSIGIGFQGQYTNRRLDYSKLTFEDQFGSGGFDINAGSGDIGTSSAARNVFDANIGLIYRFKINQFKGYAGGSIGHLAKSNENFEDTETPSNRRFAANAGGVLTLNDETDITGHLQYQERGGTHEESVLLALGRIVPTSNDDMVKVYAGTGMRVKDAWFPYVALQFNALHIGLSYDVSWPDIKSGAISRKSIEFSAAYTLGYK